MSTLAVAAALAIAIKCVGPSTAPIVVGIALHESKLNPTAIHDNATGKSYFPDTVEQATITAHSLISIGHDLDLGIAQINVRQFGWTDLTLQTAFDTCSSFKASVKILFAKYNGSPPDDVRKAYAAATSTNIGRVEGAAQSLEPVETPSAPCAPSWDAWALAACTTNRTLQTQETKR